jgi:hypothetical protein
MSQCVAPDGNRPAAALATGNQVTMYAYYDTDEHPQHADHTVMGIAIAYIATS